MLHMYRWCIAAFSSGLWNIPTPVDQVLDDRLVQTRVKIDIIVRAAVAARTASKEEIRAYGAPDVSPRIIENCLLTAGLTSRETLAMLPFTPRQRQARLLWLLKESTGEWNGALLSSVMRVGSVCMRIMDTYTA